MSGLSEQLMTADEFLAWTHREENHGRFFELKRGEVIEILPPGKFHGFLCANICENIARLLGKYVTEQGRGYVCGNDAGVILERNPDTVRGPDVSYFEDTQTADNMERGYAQQPPRLAVEVLSPHDRVNQTMQRVAELLRAGVSEVWVIDPDARDISLCRLGEEPRLLSGEETLTTEDILPGFACPIEQIFAMPGQG